MKEEKLDRYRSAFDALKDNLNRDFPDSPVRFLVAGMLAEALAWIEEAASGEKPNV